MRFSILLVLAACSSSSTSSQVISGSATKAQSTDVTVELAGVTLADECGEAGKPAPPPVKEAHTRPAGDAEAKISEGGCADPSNCHGPTQPPCEQTSMQLSLRAPADVKPTTIRIVKVELLDASGKVVDVLASRKPSRWSNDAYVTWDETLVPGQTLAASYLLTSPSWDKLTNGKWNAHTKVFSLRVTVSVGSAERTIEKQSITPVAIEPPIET